MLFLLLASLNVSAATKADTDPSIPDYSESIDESAHDKATCAKKWDRFHKSQECFSPYHNVNGTMKPGAFENCTDIKPPNECPL